MDNEQTSIATIPVSQQIAARLDTYYQAEDKGLIPCHTNRASSIGDPCARRLVYMRTDWDKARPFSLDTLKVFREGNNQERITLRDMIDAGFEVSQMQRAIDYPQHKITGHVDLFIKWQGEQWLLEIKSMSPYIWESVNTIQDFHKYSWTAKYLGQVCLYMLMSNEPRGLFALKNKSTGQIKWIEFELDYDFAESLLKKADVVNNSVDARIAARLVHDADAEDAALPARIDYQERECGDCRWKHLCCPDLKYQGFDFLDIPMLEAAIAESLELKPAQAQYNKVWDEVKRNLNAKSNSNLIVGRFFCTKSGDRWNISNLEGKKGNE